MSLSKAIHRGVINPTDLFDLVELIKKRFADNTLSEQREIFHVVKINVDYLYRKNVSRRLHSAAFTLTLSPTTVKHAEAIYSLLMEMFPNNRPDFDDESHLDCLASLGKDHPDAEYYRHVEANQF